MDMHYILTIEVPGVGMVTETRAVPFPPGTTMADAHQAAVVLALRGIAAGARVPVESLNGPITHFWHIAPNELVPAGDGR